MKKLLAYVLVLSMGTASLILGAAPATAAEISGNVTLATDYRFRGISQGDRSPAIQGGFDLETDSGFYLGTWASNVTFSGGAMELDVYGGFAGDISDDMGFDVGAIYYAYPEADSDPDLDYWEIYGSLSFWDATVGLNYSPDYFAETDTYFYLYGDYSLPLGENFSVDFHVGWNMFDSKEDGAAFGIGDEDEYFDYSVGISTAAMGVDLSLAYIGTDVSSSDCPNICDDTVVFSVSKSL